MEEVKSLVEDTFKYLGKTISEEYDYVTSDVGILESYEDSIFDADNLTTIIVQELS